MGPVGRISRFVLGGYLLLVSLPYYLSSGRTLSFLGNAYSSDYTGVSLALAMAVGFLVFYLAVHRASETWLQNLNRWLGAALANVPLFAVFVVSAFLDFGPSQIAVLTYAGAAMLLAGWRKDQGCEVMSPANAIMGRQTNFACVVFSPIDWAEERARGLSEAGKSGVGSVLGSPSLGR